MNCRTLKNRIDGSAMIVCGSRTKPKPCAFCGEASTKLCDFPVTVFGLTRTCEEPLCESCAKPVGENRDYCGPHFERAEAEAMAIRRKALNP